LAPAVGGQDRAVPAGAIGGRVCRSGVLYSRRADAQGRDAVSELDRVAGTLLGMAAGDALGAGYEFGYPQPSTEIRMKGGGCGPFEPGEWTDDTSMAICIAEVTAAGSIDPAAIGDRFLDWYRSGPKDVGNLTAAVLSRADRGVELTSVAATSFERNPRGAAGNGALMRTAPVALAHLGDDRAMADAAMEVAALTHGDPLAGESCVLWCVAIDRAVREGRLDGARDGLALLPGDRRAFWSDALDAAASQPPGTFAPNGFTVTALQAAHAAIVQTPIPAELPARHLQHALEASVRIGYDTDTVAAIAGMVLGARWGASAMPFRWRRMLHGWPGMRARDLVRLAVLTARGGRPMSNGWPSAPRIEGAGEPGFPVPLPGDEGVLLGNLTSLDMAGREVDAVVSLCRVGTEQVPDGVEHHEVWLVDGAGDGSNPNLDLVVEDTVEALRALRGEGKRVFLHCVAGASRTPFVAAAYLADLEGIPTDEALAQVASAIGCHDPWNRGFHEALERRPVAS
jgi:ADP-ribosyl-[dinitrogen reductase] hydrolase